MKNGFLHADICVIGAGSGGLSVAAGAVQMGASVVLVEKGLMGGDCLNTGCVPSKALIAAAHAAKVIQSGQAFGVSGHEPVVDFSKVHAHVHGVINAIAPHDSINRFEALGVSVISGAARFIAADVIEADSAKIRARRFVVATGSSAAVPSIPGLANVPFLTNENVFHLTERPGHLIVIGGGPIGVELAQAFRRLGSNVTLLERFGLLAEDELEAVEVVRHALAADGVVVSENTQITGVSRDGQTVKVLIESADGDARAVSGTHILVAAGRQPNTSGLGLDAAGIKTSRHGITVDARLRTTNKRVYAIGDVAGGPQFTHVAAYQAGIVIRNVLFGLPASVNYKALPWVTYTDPELAHVGLTETEARKVVQAVQVLISPVSANDRAQTERSTDGLAKIMLGPNGRILGATIVGSRAGELISLWGLAISVGLRIGSVARLTVPYPSYSEISKRVASTHFVPTLFGPRMRYLVGLIQRVLP